jgi:hypothetical protein
MLGHRSTVEIEASEQFKQLLTLLAPEGCPDGQVKQAVELIGYRLKRESAQQRLAEEHLDTIAAIQCLLDRSATVDDGADYWWNESVWLFAETRPDWVASAAALAISGEDYSKQREAAWLLTKLAVQDPRLVMKVIGDCVLDKEKGWKWLFGPYKGIFNSLPADIVMHWLDQVGVDGARRIARHLPSPSADASGHANVPEFTARVLAKFGSDEEVIGEFCAGRHNLEVFVGDIASTYEAHARTAKAFLNHPIAAIREWAARESASARALAEPWRKEQEDESFEP